IIMFADLALYHVKNSGKNHFAYFNNIMADHLRYKLDNKKILQHAIENDGFRMVYQPQISLKTGRITGYEALVRLKEYNISPSDFIGAAEENGLIIPLGRIITKLVVEQMSIWNQLGFPPKPIAINFSVLQLNDIGFKDYLQDLLSEYGVEPEYIELEITEHIFMEKKEAAIELINDLKTYGIRFTIDDFGAEYSSLSYLASLPIDALKLDRELNHRFLDFENPEVMESLINFIHSLGKSVIAEGIEEFRHVKKLIKSSCDSVQGFYFSEPLDAEDVWKEYNKTYNLMQNDE
ncbi:MAG: EAL domain-containing protein, partial [Bacillota bacterium]